MKPSAPTKPLRFEVVDDMKLGKVIKNAGFRQHNVIGGDLLEIRWARGAGGVVRNLTKNFFAVMSYQMVARGTILRGGGYRNLMPFAGLFLSHHWARLPYAIALACMFFLYAGMSVLFRRSSLVLPASSGRHPAFHLHHAAFNVLFTLWNVAWSGAAPSIPWMS